MGSSSATVSAGPMPGRTPIAVPMVTPSADHIRLKGVIATAKPWARAARVSISLVPSRLAGWLKSVTRLSGGATGRLVRLGQEPLEHGADRQIQIEAIIEESEGQTS